MSELKFIQFKGELYTSLKLLCTKPLYHCWWRCSYISISSGAQYMTLKTYFSHASFSYLLFSNPTHKTETGRTANRWGTTNSKPCGTNHYDRPIRNTEQQHSDQFITLFSQSSCAFCHPPQKLCNYVEPKLFF